MKRLFVSAVAVAAVAAVAACGSSGSGASSSSSKGSVLVMAFGVQSSAAFGFPEAVTAVQGAAKAINAADGINGRQIVVESCNDGNDPNLAAACARKAVQDKVAAVIGYISANDAAIDPLLDAAHIPYIGGDGEPDYAADIAYPVTGEALVGQIAVSIALGKAGCRNLATVVNDIPQAVLNSNLASKAFQGYGGKTTVITLPTTQTDFSPSAAHGASAGAKCMVPSFGPAGNISAAKAFASQLSSVQMGFIGFGLNQQIIGSNASLLQGALVSSPWVPTGTWRDEVTKQMAAIDPSAAVDDYAISAWTSLNLFAAAAKAVSGPINGAAVISELKSKTFTVPSIGTYDATKPGPDPKLPHLFNTSAYIYKISGGKLVADPQFPTPISVNAVLAQG